MRQFLAILVLSLFLSGCASLNKEVTNDLRVGDDTGRVLEELGEPDSSGPSATMAGAQDWSYTKRGDVCVVTIYNDHLAYAKCNEIPGYKSPGIRVLGFVGKVLSGAGKGLAQAQKNTVNCFTNCDNSRFGSSCYTNCQ